MTTTGSILTGLVNAVVTVTDGDGDTATDTYRHRRRAPFHDDGPTAAIVDGGGTVIIDETADEPGRRQRRRGSSGAVRYRGHKQGHGPVPTEFAVSTTPLVSVAGSETGNDEEGATTAISLEVVGGDNIRFGPDHDGRKPRHPPGEGGRSDRRAGRQSWTTTEVSPTATRATLRRLPLPSSRTATRRSRSTCRCSIPTRLMTTTGGPDGPGQRGGDGDRRR